MVSEEFITRLQAMNASGEIEGYICSQISRTTLEPDWIIQGLTHNGLKGRIDTKANRKQFLTPMDLAVRLMIDEGLEPTTGMGIIILGQKGLTERKLVVFLRGFPEHQEVLTFQTSKGYNPQDIIRLILKYELNEVLSTQFIEPDSNYTEQLKTDTLEEKVLEALTLRIPKKKFHAPTWIRDSSNQEDSEYLLYRYGDQNQIPPFSLLFTSWFLGLDYDDVLISMILREKESCRSAIWDTNRGIAFFAIFRNESLEEIARKYLLSLWSLEGEKIGPPIKTREVIIESRKLSTMSEEDSRTDQAVYEPSIKADDTLPDLEQKIAQIRERLDEISIPQFLMRLENVEAELSSLRNEFPLIDSQMQERLNGVLVRLEAMVKRLEELDERIEQISSENQV
jgi:hypothetical protein